MEFQAWPKIPRLNRDIIITEMIDGTNSAVIIEPFSLPFVGEFDERNVIAYADAPVDGMAYAIGAQSRNRLITPGKETDNFGFAQWVYANSGYLAETLGPGRHFGEWWGQGIARKYGMDRKVFSLFNVERYADLEQSDTLRLVPELYRGPFSQEAIEFSLHDLRQYGSSAAPGFLEPEGIIVFHTAAQQVFKVTLENDEVPKALAA